MTSHASDGVAAQPAGDHAPAWHVYTSKRYPSGLRVHAPDGSYAAQVAQAELREAERTRLALEKLLAPEGAARHMPVDIYLVDPVIGEDPLLASPAGAT